jgi:hypothetical protein
MANSTFFSSKYGDLEPQKNSFGLVAPFFIGGGSPTGENSPQIKPLFTENDIYKSGYFW